MYITFISQSSPHKLSADISPYHYSEVMSKGMLDNIRLKEVLLTVHDEDKKEVWYSFDNVKAGIPGFIIKDVQEES